MTIFRSVLTKALLLSVVVASAMLSSVFNAEAQGVTMLLTVNGGSNAQIVNGQSVTLDWYIDGPITNCSINNGVGVIDTSTLPATGTMMYTPPSNSNTNFVLNCDGQTSSVTVAIAPVVTMSLSQGSPRTNNLNGRLDRVDVAWDAPLATRCGNVSRSSASISPNPKVASHDAEYWSKYQNNGWMRYRGWPHDYITETTTFFITCYNDVAGTSATGSVTLNVLDPAPPADPIINMWTNTPFVNPDPLYGYGIADVRFSAFNVTWCDYNAYYPDGSPYASLPQGYGAWGGHIGASFTSVRVASSTLFEVTCSRPALTIGGIVYPATSTTNTVFVDVIQGSSTIDRTLLPPVTISATATPNTVVRDPITGRGTTTIDLTVANADYCYLRAHRLSDDSQYSLHNWTRLHSWNRLGGNNTYSFYLSDVTIDTRLNIECIRQFDVDFFNPGDPEYTQGYETLDVVIIATSSPNAAPAPQVSIYGNGFFPTAWDISQIETSSSNFFINSGNNWYKTNNGAPVAPLYGEVTFPFDHPFDGTDTYDIYLRYCDENDGDQNTFSVSVNGGAVLGTLVTDDPNASDNNCNEDTELVKRIATGVSLTEGDAVTVGCQNDDLAGGETCRLLQVYFGAGSGDGSTLAAQTSSTTGFAEIPLFWYSEYVTKCDAGDSWATPVANAGLAYPWRPSNWNDIGTDYESIATSTTFSTRCYRSGDSLDATSIVTIDLPASFSLSASTSISTGQCKDPITLQSITAPVGYMADPNTGLCVLAIDLSAFSPSPNIAGAITDNVYGTYDNLDALIAIENRGPGELPQGSAISYMATIDPHPAHALPLISSPVGSYNATMTAPIASTSPTMSPTLTGVLDGVPFGTHQLCSRVNLDGTPNFPEWNTNASNNQNCTSISLPVPPPPMSLAADRDLVRKGQQSLLTWSINVAYLMNCSVQGPGGLNVAFDTLTEGFPYTDTFLTNGLTSTSEFVFQCTEPITNTVFTETVRVEVNDGGEEI